MEEKNLNLLHEIIARPVPVVPIDDFQMISKVIVVPVMEEFVEKIKAGGHDARVAFENVVEMEVNPINRPSGKLRFELSGNKIAIFMNGSPRGKVDMETLDAILVEEHVLAFLSSIF